MVSRDADRVVVVLAAAILSLLLAGVLVLQQSTPAPALSLITLNRDLPEEAETALAEVPPSLPLVDAEDVPAPTPTAVPAPTAQPTPVVTAAPTPQPPAATGPSFPSPIRGVWVHVLDGTLLTRGSIEAMLDDVVNAGGNTVVVEVARRYDSYYASDFLDRGQDAGFEPGLDVLQAVIDGAVPRGLSVHAWFTAMPAWQPETANTPEPHNWTYTQHGAPAPDDQKWLTRSATGEWGEYLDPGHPDVQNLVIATAAELATYDVDAVHVDYLRYPGAEWGYNPVALGRFQADTGRTDIPAPSDQQFSDWRRQQTTDIAIRMREAVQQVDPTVGVSAALIAWGDGPVNGRVFEQTPAWSQVFQPWPQWMAAGIIDVAMPMVYFRESRHASFHRNWMSYIAGLRQATGVMTAPGQGSWLNDVDQSLLQLTEAAPFMDGEVLFSYQQTAAGEDPKALLPALAGSLWGQ